MIQDLFQALQNKTKQNKNKTNNRRHKYKLDIFFYC